MFKVEKRKFPRLLLKFPITCQIFDPSNNTSRNKTVLGRDLSPEGIYFESDGTLPLNTEIKVSFQLPKSSSIIQANLKVIRVEVLQREESFGIGALFTQISEKDKKEINYLIERTDINRLLELAIKEGASDMHLTVGSSCVLRVNGEIKMQDTPLLDAEDISGMVYSLMSKQQSRIFEQEKELDFGIQFGSQNRFRVNVHQQRGAVEATLRLINISILSFEELRIPEVVKDLARLNEGLVLIGGPTGSGKTTTIAAMIEFINNQKKAVIITLERPTEYLYTNIKSIIKQREVGVDTYSFSAALKSSLKQDPDIIVVGELEDIETIRTALIAAESGHLVIASLHAPNTTQVINRIVNMFLPEHRKQILFQLSQSLKGIITELLIPRQDKKGRVLACEVLITTEAVRRVIRSDELIQIMNIIQTGGSYKMQLMSDSIRRLVEQKIVDPEIAQIYAKEYDKYIR